MKTLLRLCTAAALAALVTACGEGPTAPQTNVAPARMSGGPGIGGGSITDADTATVSTVSSDQTTGGTTCVDARGPVIGGGGHFIGEVICD